MNDNKETIIELKTNGPDTINVIQITDTHILDEGAPSFNDYDTSASLVNIIKEIKTNESSTDLILLTGDLVHGPAETSYQKLADYLSVLINPIFYIPGNHDDPGLMNYILGANGYDSGKLIRAGQWLIILLNTCVKGEHFGELSDTELGFLRTSLESSLESHCLIALHHHPVAINSSWMDAMALINADVFLNVIDDFDHIRAIIWGHIHQAFELDRKNVKLLGSPSTCLQFKPGSDVFAVDEKSPAYRELMLKDDGTIKTSVIYLGNTNY
ncbi:MAG: 3',5'-cyclic-AMP phosphodiesterase [Proteobacteria bacterium]|nr:3',5'-cyclic-AMP phosphodiesterase [Pseudomonadota bacterium]